MKHIKPRTLGILHRPFTVSGRSRLVVSPICFFELVTGRVVDETDGWRKIVPRLGPETCLDPVFPKQHAEVLLAGSAHAPRGTRVTEMVVGLKIGAVDKQLRVWGDRKLIRGILPASRLTEPQPFDEMPLVCSRAFGGPHYPANPVGKGHQTLRARLTEREVELPNIEPLRSSDPEPAGFVPLGLDSPVRRGHSGTYDSAWLSHDFPGFPGDVERLFFNAAPVDQQQRDPWRGDETFELRGMHPTLPRLAGQLPGVLARAFVQRKAEPLHEVPLHAETVWLFPHLDLTDMGLGDAGLGAVIFRGETEIEDSDGLDVASVMIAYERLTDPPRPFAHYLHVHALRTGDPKTQLAHVLNEGPLSPVPTAELEAQLEEERERALAEYYASFKAVSDGIVEENPQLAKLEGYSPPECPPPKLGVLSKEALARGDVDLTEMLAKADAWEKEARKEAAKLEAKAAEAMAKLPPDPTKQDPASPRAVAAAVAERVARAMRQPRKLGGSGMGEGKKIPEIPKRAHEIPAVAALLEKASAAGAPSVPSMEELEDDTRGRRSTPKPKEIDAAHRVPIGRALRELVERCVAAGASLAGRDLAGADLSGLRFESSDLRELLLEHADLRGATFVDCRMEGCTLAGACLDGATFVGCDLSNANLCGTRGVGTELRDCDLAEGLWLESTWCEAAFVRCGWRRVIANEMQAQHCRFDESRFEETFLVKADLSHSSFERCQGARTLLVAAKLGSARFYRSAWERTVAVDIDGDGSCWDESTLDRVQFGGGSRLMDVSLRSVRAKQTGFRGAALGAAQLQGSIFESCDFGDVTLRGANLTGAAFFGSVLMGARLVESDLRGARFYEALLNKVRIEGCDVADANFYGANCQGAAFQGVGDARLEGLNPAGVEVQR